MCRFFGNVSLVHSLPVLQEFGKLTLLSKSGGPDHTGFYADELCRLGFNRLSILDTSESGNQPIKSPSGRYILMLNGEVYNFRELAAQYMLTGLRSGSDAEVVAHLLDKLPLNDIPEKLNGMFAISVWDTLDRELFLCRDFAGIKPLFYGHTNRGLVFGSQFNQILLHPWYSDWTWSDTGLREYLQFGFMPPPYTVAQTVYQLPPGTFLRYAQQTGKLDVKVFQRFFNSDILCLSEKGPAALKKGKEVLQAAVDRQLVSDVPLGLFLSGGIDSTLVAAIASKIRPDIETLTVGFEETEYDESEKAAEYARVLNVKNERILLSTDELLRLFSEHNLALTEPIADYSTLPTFLISKVASKRYKVMLSGDGGDELFWGYPRFRVFANSARYFKFPTPALRKLLRNIFKAQGKELTGFLGSPDLGTANLSFHSYLSPGFLEALWPESGISHETANDYRFTETDPEQTLLYLRRNEFYQHLQKILVKVDRMSMANGLEVRVPLLDRELIEFANSLKPAYDKRGFELKFLLKHLLSEYIPRELINKNKQGFTPPLQAWSRTVLHDQIFDVINTGKNLNWPFKTIDNLLENATAYLSGRHDDVLAMWSVFTLITWANNINESKECLRVI